MARKLIGDGYSKIFVLKGGWREWFSSQYPVEKK
jgi:3-mercaptopyruvate sulfurtransferase SseA